MDNEPARPTGTTAAEASDETRAVVLVVLSGLGGAVALASASTGPVWLPAASGLLAVVCVAAAVLAPVRRAAPPVLDPADPVPVDDPDHDGELAPAEWARRRCEDHEAEAIAARRELIASLRARQAQRLPATAGPAAALDPAGGGADDPLPEPIRPGAGDLVADPDTGIFTRIFFEVSLDKRIGAARRKLRPLSVAVVDIVEGEAEGISVHPPARRVAELMEAAFREADTIARDDDGHFLILMEDTPETGAIWTLERFRRRLAEDLPGHTMWAGLSCYPVHGFATAQLLEQARTALSMAREWPGGRIEVAPVLPD